MELEDSRREYRFGRLTRESLSDSPFEQFDLWMQQAISENIQDPTAMSLSTVDGVGKPSQRIVLLKHFDRDGFVFYTNLESRKAREIGTNSRVSLLFPWLQLDRQVIVEGEAEKLDMKTVLKYFISRPRDSQLAAWASTQSRKIDARSILEGEFLRLKTKFTNNDIPLPSFWGGYRVVPDRWEFWQGGEHRLHDRFQYSEFENGWDIVRLAP
ncbi:MAG: pyridoxamine 5'-phosphate oxidase [Gammaproteobacteria bacterium]|jgi:pyridoxamine 5'-phosphate oxidase|nr:pyridoxamine 5'-phosphate oxidase [Gammaproteobacteria bacterium]MBT4493411.1 pyridoxamine 5'-phosphate oxidase [Gammaproteobacteria bacterium]MBT7369926.1 pyridoxamine 5'-phosphate oxidase [Gammaproteobacteria bacterium]